MIRNISFGGIYQVTTKANSYKKYVQFKDFTTDKEKENNDVENKQQRIVAKYPPTCTLIRTTSVPDSMDKEIETYCTDNEIVYSKIG